MNYAVILPVLNPDEKFTNFVQERVRSEFETIVVVNDGSSSDYDHFYHSSVEHLGRRHDFKLYQSTHGSSRTFLLLHRCRRPSGTWIQEYGRVYLPGFP